MSSVSFGKIFARARWDTDQDKIIESIPEKVKGAYVKLMYKNFQNREDVYYIVGLDKFRENNLVDQLKKYGISAETDQPKPEVKFSWSA